MLTDTFDELFKDASRTVFATVYTNKGGETVATEWNFSGNIAVSLPEGFE